MRSFARLGAVVGASTLAVAGLVTVSPSAQAVAPKDPIGVNTGAAWLAKQLTHGIVHNNQFNFADYGLTIDVALGLDAVGGHASEVSDIADALAPGSNANYTTSTYHGVTTTYAGQVAKLMVLVQKAGGDPTSYGGHDLTTMLEGTVASAAPIAGRIQDQNNTFGDANVLGQAYAARALATASSSKASSVLSFLLEQQCPNGGFRLTFNADKTAVRPELHRQQPAQIDVTSVALIEMRGLTGTSTAVTNADDYLIGKQHLVRCLGRRPGRQRGELQRHRSRGLGAGQHVAVGEGSSVAARPPGDVLRLLHQAEERRGRGRLRRRRPDQRRGLGRDRPEVRGAGPDPSCHRPGAARPAVPRRRLHAVRSSADRPQRLRQGRRYSHLHGDRRARRRPALHHRWPRWCRRHRERAPRGRSRRGPQT